MLTSKSITFFFYLGLYLILNRLQLLIYLLNLPHHGCLGMSEGRKILFGLFSLLFHTLNLLAGGLILLGKRKRKYFVSS